ncbi:MAG: Hpt domain-containing protein, partial [Proteobacteria bacterium]|nr:Hpt domain-containing protein [Pseudomonadota bacterium]
MDDLIRDFVVESLESLDQLDAELLRFEREPHDSRILDQIYRLLHTIKGTCGFLSLHRLERIAHNAEDLISRFRDGHRANRDEVTLTLAAIDRVKGIIHGLADQGGEPEGEDSELITELMAAAQRKGAAPTRAAAVAAPSTPTAEPVMMRQNVRVGVERLDHLMTMVSELVLVRNQLMELARREDAGGFKLPLQRLSHITAELQDGVMRTRMQSIGAAWSKISRTVRDLSNELGKDIRLETVGAETEIDRQILEVIKDCIVHLVRNAADHGIETPAERVAAGKAPYGTIRLTAGQEGSQIVMEISDDGRGLDLDGIRMRAFGQGLADDEA